MPRPLHRRSFASPTLRRIVVMLAVVGVSLAVISFSPFGERAVSSHKNASSSKTVSRSTALNSAPAKPIAAASDPSTIALDAAATAAALARDIALIQQLSVDDPANAREIGYARIASLQHTGAFDRAAAYAAESPAALRRDLVIAAFHDWGRQHPEAAWTYSIHLTDPTAREFAMQSVLSGWARSHPEELAETALHFPEGAEKTAALTKALRSWMIRDPWKAGDWILAHEAAIPVAEKFFADDER